MTEKEALKIAKKALAASLFHLHIEANAFAYNIGTYDEALKALHVICDVLKEPVPVPWDV